LLALSVAAASCGRGSACAVVAPYSSHICSAAARAAAAFRCSWSYPAGASPALWGSLTTLTGLLILTSTLVATAEASAVPVTSTRRPGTSVVTASTPARTHGLSKREKWHGPISCVPMARAYLGSP